ncbi:hypothetical protein [Coleofasciculus sp. F4-SAH-05]|uniref:hypothetical protein n=1 Tax=Coleofasciculus sp. F4-SAH-05 TaxID=3069525 RepID=UPI0032F1B934
MLVQYRGKIVVNGIEVYPDFENTHQFWYIPSEIKLAERNNSKIFSHIWYIASTSDEYGDGFLNYEVNMAVENSTLDKIKQEINRQWGIAINDIQLAPVTYSNGQVSLVALQPLDDGDTSQTVWDAGSPSLVGNNAAVCSVEFPKEGQLAAAMFAAIQEKRNSVMAAYILSYKAMTPAIQFRVNGEFKAFLNDFKLSANLPIPIKKVILDFGLQIQFQASFQKTNMEIELINYDGEEESQGLELAMQILYEYMLPIFFEYQLSPSDSWNPLSEQPEIIDDIVAAGDMDDAGVKALSEEAPPMMITINVSNYTGIQENQLKFMYSESRAKYFTIAPQSAVLEQLDNPDDYISQINRSDFPFGQPFNVSVGAPGIGHEEFTDRNLVYVKVNATYPPGGGSKNDLEFRVDGVDKDNPMPFQYNAKGDTDVGYSVSYLYEPSNNWKADKNQYDISDCQTEANAISAFSGEILDFVTILTRVNSNFIWGDQTKRVDVTIECEGYSGTITQSFFPDDVQEQSANIRVEKQRSTKRRLKSSISRYSYKLLDGMGNVIYETDVRAVNNFIITVSDQYREHVPIPFFNALPEQGIIVAFVSVHYQGENGEKWDSEQIRLTPDNRFETKEILLATLTEYPDKEQLLFSYKVKVIKQDTSEDNYEETDVNPTQAPFVITGTPPTAS